MNKIYKKLKLVLSVLLLCIVPAIVFGQSKITGKVTDESQQPLPGVSVSVSGTKTVSVTDANGNYSIAAQSGQVLIFKFIGYSQQSLTIGDSPVYNLSFKVENKVLNEVVVTALGVKKETKRLGYSVQEIKGAELTKAREANAINGLTGKIAGLNVGINQEILASPTVLLRGSPLNFYVVDGIPINTDTQNISPDDIDSYTVLKGPTAAALYGSRGINGAILITTKRGKADNKGFVIELNSSTQFNRGFIAIPKVQNNYGGGDNDKYAFGDGAGGGVNDGDYDVWGPRLNAGLMLPQYDGAYDPTQTYTTTFKDGSTFKGHIKPTPWVARGVNNLEGFLQTGLLTSNNVSISSSTEKANVRMSVTNGYQRGITPNTGLNTINFNLLGSLNLSKQFKVEGNINYNRQFSKNIPDVTYGPNSIIYDVDLWTGADWNIDDMRNYWQPGKEGIQSVFVEYKRYQNPWFQSYEWLRGHYKNDVYAWGAFTYSPDKNLDITLRSNITTNNVLRTEKEPFSAHPYGDEHNHGNYREDRRDLFENNTDLLVKYNLNNISNSGVSISALAGGTLRTMKYTSSFVTTDQLLIHDVYTFQNSINPVKSYNFDSDLITTSAYASADITYKNYFTISATGRTEKSSALLNQSYFYPSVSISSPISDYVKLPEAISFLKVRASYANVKDGGTSAFVGPAGYPLGYGNSYQTTYGGPSYQVSTPAYIIGPSYGNITSASAPTYTVDPKIKPSSRSNYEGGIDLRFLKDRLGFSGTYFIYKDGPQIYSQPQSETNGSDQSFLTNGYATKRTGYEVSVNGSAIATRNFKWDVLMNVSTYKEVYDAFPGQQKIKDQFFKVGDRVDKLYGAKEAQTVDGKVIHDKDGIPVYLPVAQYLGNADPDFTWAINNKFRYKEFTLSFQFDGGVGGKIRDYVYRKLIEGGRGAATDEGIIGQARAYESEHWGDPGFKGAVFADGTPMLGHDGVTVAPGSPAIQFDPITGVITNMDQVKFAANTTPVKYVQDYVNKFYNDPQHTVISRTYAKLREVVVGYSLPKPFVQKLRLSKVEFSLVGRNLLYFFKKGYKDIDVDQYPGRNQLGQTSLESGLQTPTTRSYGFNINVVY
ncbi:TonB-linked outer membrane protein, SusC/RagA family [Mucilaginibacter pineti]|uniref:TonB-linked outer membrane protein, SusC/RagA family n=1 Tax=Mucilaginibacter pineti TaxID=1391627 RepID=A0A1G7HF44_9SPHI|nr:SusC/RagA family TonB-linked outer membrane protein [Mucilaginibacter pineti]SDE99080.1 TonB-linked outer membrane protein, SusC/RagA family [Mucilaginibacter pineti]